MGAWARKWADRLGAAAAIAVVGYDMVASAGRDAGQADEGEAPPRAPLEDQSAALKVSETRRLELEAMLKPPGLTDLERWMVLIAEARTATIADPAMSFVHALADMAEKAVQRTTMLRAALNIDRTGLAAALVEVMNIARGYQWITAGRGSYAWDDEQYREETGRALDAIIVAAVSALRRSGDLATNVIRDEQLPDPAKPVLAEVVLQGMLIDERQLTAILAKEWGPIRASVGREDELLGLPAWMNLSPHARLAIVRSAQLALRSALQLSKDSTAQIPIPLATTEAM